jgi:hypothetical protein
MDDVTPERSAAADRGAFAGELLVLADRLRRLHPSRTDPELFHVERDEIAVAMRRLAERLGRGA